MAKLYLNTTNTAYKVSNTGDEVYGTSGTQIVTIDSGVTGIVLDGNVEGAKLSGAIANYDYKQTGNILNIYNAGTTTLVTAVPVQEPTTGNPFTKLTFANGSVDVKFNTSNGILIGDALVNATTAQTVTPSASTITATDTSGGTATPVAGSTFTLTAGFDNLTGTTADDTFNGIAGQTLSAGDAIAGGAGSDNLNILVTTATGSPEVFDATGLETISVRNLSGGSQTVSAANWLGYTTLVNDRSTTSSNVAFSSVASNIALVLNKSASNTTVSYNTDVFKGSSDAVTVTATDATAGTLTLTSAASAEKVETINLASNGTANVITDIVATNGASKLVVSGSANLTLSSDVAIPTVDASTATGKISLVATGTYAATNPSSVDVTDLTITTGTGNDTIDVSGVVAASEISVNAGAGDDKVVIAATGSIAYDAATSTVAADVINGGDGNDTLSVNGNLTADLTGVVSGFEILDFSASASGTAITTTKLDISKFSSTGDAVDVVLTGLANNSTFTINGDGSDLDASIATDSSADALNVVLAGTGTTTGAALIAQNYETLNITSNSDSDLNTNKIASVSSSSYVSKVTLSGSTNLAGGTITVKSAATFDASAYTGDLTATTFGASVKSYIGGTGKDEITLYAEDLKQGNTFAGGAGTDKLTVTAGASQNAGILAVTGFETISITGNDSSADTVTADFRNVTGLTTLLLNSGSGDGDSFIINRLITGVNVQVDSALAALTIGNESGAVQNVKLGAAVTTLTVDAAASTLNISNVYNGGNALTTLVGASLTNIIVTEKLATTGILNLGSALSSVTSIDASALITSQVTGALGAAGTATGGKLGDNLTGSAGKDTITGNQGNDTINGGSGTDTIVFGTETTNGADALTIKAGAINTGTVANDGDILKFAAFLPNGSVDQNGGTGNTITAYTTSSVGDTNITNKVALITGSEADVNETSEIALLIEGSGDAFSITAGGKAVVISGVASATSGSSDEQGRIFFVNDANGDGSITTAEVTLVGTTAVDFSIGGFVSTNFAFA